MLPEDELHDLAESIKTEGQIKEIVLDRDGVLLDGRNRLAACTLAGVEPRFTCYEGDSPQALILSANLYRRHISKGQQAMITVMARSLSGHSLRTQAKLHTISLSVLSRANVVLEHGPGLAEQVRIGALRLDAAYDEVCRRKAQAAVITAQYDNLLRRAPDLAAQVAEQLLTLDEATTKLGRRLEEERLRQRVKKIDAVRQADGDTTLAHTHLAEQGEITWQQAHQLAEQHHTQRQENIQRAQQAIEQISANWTAIQNVTARPDTPYTREILEGLTPEAHTLIQGLTTQA